MGRYVVAVDVGTGSARAGIFDRRGEMLGRASFPIEMNRTSRQSAEHDSEDIWAAVTRAVSTARDEAGVAAGEIDAIGFDATCSLTVRDSEGLPLPVSQNDDPRWDTIAWLDHRALEQAEELTALGGEMVKHSGGSISPEMQIPKLMWLKSHRPDVWNRAGMIFDLADFLTWRASGSLTRSVCTMTAKWNYLSHTEEGWPGDFLDRAGLAELGTRAGITDIPAQVGACVGMLTASAAQSLGLTTNCKVASGMVDAYAGQLALTGKDPDSRNEAGLIGGTSSCVMRFSKEPQFIKSFWGPYRDVVLPDWWVIEGGQSATGALLDHIVRVHGAGLEPTPETHDLVLERIRDLIAETGEGFGGSIHVLPDFHGNRSPLGDARVLGAIHGLTLDGSFDAMCAIYYRAMVSLALGMRQILDLMEFDGPVETLHLGGGHARNTLLARLYADATRRQVAISAGEEAMLLGTAMAAASAAGWYPSLAEACQAMARPANIIPPNEIRAMALDRDYHVFLKMQEQRRELAAIV
ncbi:FGGY family pentulose kinase [Rhizobium sp. TH2]|uniref:FGGY-family carbohydrate kinase n=1 Tax=Rhizobium sp. TH2 TaxID=2775403 RepID=UPI002157D4A4|nr:FGGY family pentulose kinase [Rhizobium sp. TH2]UVC08746.1 FGGY family pentulose kinase [Rhizobium sp. TH2]